MNRLVDSCTASHPAGAELAFPAQAVMPIGLPNEKDRRSSSCRKATLPADTGKTERSLSAQS